MTKLIAISVVIVIVVFLSFNVYNKSMDTQKIILQIVIDLPELEQYYHLDVPGRKPLAILKNGVVSTDGLNKFGEPVVYIEKPDEGRAYLEFTKRDVGENTADVEFLYPAEGVRGTVNLRLANGKWEVVDKSIAER